jgi:hypothetical protein
MVMHVVHQRNGERLTEGQQRGRREPPVVVFRASRGRTSGGGASIPRSSRSSARGFHSPSSLRRVRDIRFHQDGDLRLNAHFLGGRQLRVVLGVQTTNWSGWSEE